MTRKEAETTLLVLISLQEKYGMLDSSIAQKAREAVAILAKQPE